MAIYAQSLDGESFLPMVWGAGGYEGAMDRIWIGTNRADMDATGRNR